VRRDNPWMGLAGSAREALARRLGVAYADGLMSTKTYSIRIAWALSPGLLDPDRVVGDLYTRPTHPTLRDRWASATHRIVPRKATLLALDWDGGPSELRIGRSSSCDLMLSDPTVSRRHARLICRGGKWVLQDLGSTNGTALNGRRVGRCELRPGDELMLGHARLRVD
jgi:FHA domain-containing protein